MAVYPDEEQDSIMLGPQTEIYDAESRPMQTLDAIFEKKMSKRYYTEISKYTSRETVVLDSKRAYVEFAVFCEDESHADALVKELNRRGYEIGEFHACMIAVDLKVKS